MNQKGSSEVSREAESDAKEGQSFILGLWGVRYQVKDVSRSVAFYTKQLGFKLDQQNLPAFAQVSVGALKLILSGPGASGSRPMPDGRQQEPGGWNRFMIITNDIDGLIGRLNTGGVKFRGEISEAGAGRARLLEDPSGNLIELFEFKKK